ncbi:TadE/TadG family type IV pilus assembly protein [Roseivivax isoporae]|uniref:Flp pilus assembly protein TadG n=1 Tax=Roseivivax isoporae LMG 25204 TaxID=1449351 RepID=X7F5L8_9RHOB|nr:hypothetical protein [Roseivivax isoporae]ETX27379.1 hypothetical protein RISW2_14380 [Roseivivax isoporae LMG 25204]
MRKTSLPPRLARFGRDEDGYITTEAMIVLPVLLWLLGAVWVWFDVSREQSIDQKVNYTIGDMISRETDPIDDAYIDNTYRLALEMIGKPASKVDLRITVVQFLSNRNGGNARYEVVWSEARGAFQPLSGTIDPEVMPLPLMARNDEVILVQTWSDHEPVFKAGLSPFDIRTYSFTRPRFAPQILFEGADGTSGSNQNNGWGNGDQDAPGNSLCNNNAENYDEGQSSQSCQDNVDGGANVEPGNSGGA